MLRRRHPVAIDQAGQLQARRDVELDEDVAHVGLDGSPSPNG